MAKIVILTSDESEDKTLMLVPDEYDHYELEKIADENDLPAPTIAEFAITVKLLDWFTRHGVEPYQPFTG